jgi:pimeloyl-ACP methyl ester carboxylesterase
MRSLTLHAGADTLRVSYVDLSPPVVNGRTALLLHGADAGADRWAATADGLAAAGYRVIVPDVVPEAADAAHPAAPGAPAPLPAAALASHAADLLDALGVPEATVIGHGGGAEAAVRLARLARGVSGVALVAPAASLDLAGLALPVLVLPDAPGHPAGRASLDSTLLAFLGR